MYIKKIQTALGERKVKIYTFLEALGMLITEMSKFRSAFKSKRKAGLRFSTLVYKKRPNEIMSGYDQYFMTLDDAGDVVFLRSPNKCAISSIKKDFLLAEWEIEV